MKISSNEEYGLRILLTIAKISCTDSFFEQENEGSQKERLVTLGEIAKFEGITTDYAMIFISQLKNAKLIESVRGKNGGYRLSRNPEETSLAEVMKALSDEMFGTDYCDSHSGGHLEHCAHSSNCSIRPLWSNLSSLLDKIFGSIKLSDLLSDEEEFNKNLQAIIASSQANSDSEGMETKQRKPEEVSSMERMKT